MNHALQTCLNWRVLWRKSRRLCTTIAAGCVQNWSNALWCLNKKILPGADISTPGTSWAKCRWTRGWGGGRWTPILLKRHTHLTLSFSFLFFWFFKEAFLIYLLRLIPYKPPLLQFCQGNKWVALRDMCVCTRKPKQGCVASTRRAEKLFPGLPHCQADVLVFGRRSNMNQLIETAFGPCIWTAANVLGLLMSTDLIPEDTKALSKLDLAGQLYSSG